MKTETSPQSFRLGSHEVRLYVSDRMFMPNVVTRRHSRVDQIPPDSIVFDLGAGIGPLTIWAALEPSKHVHAVDIVQAQCDMIARNVELNNVADKVSIHCGDSFDPIPEGVKADVIIVDVSGISAGPCRALGWYPDEVPIAGKDGTDYIIPLLHRAADYMLDGARLYYGVSGLSDDEKIIAISHKIFGNIECIFDKPFPLTVEEAEAIKTCSSNGDVYTITRKGSRQTWRGRIFKCTDPK